MATAKKSTAKTAAPKPAAKAKRSTPKPPADVQAAIEKKQPKIEVKAGDVVKVYHHGKNPVLNGTVIAVHEGFRIDALLTIPGAESESRGCIHHISNSGSPSDCFWDN